MIDVYIMEETHMNKFSIWSAIIAMLSSMYTAKINVTSVSEPPVVEPIVMEEVVNEANKYNEVACGLIVTEVEDSFENMESSTMNSDTEDVTISFDQIEEIKQSLNQARSTDDVEDVVGSICATMEYDEGSLDSYYEADEIWRGESYEEGLGFGEAYKIGDHTIAWLVANHKTNDDNSPMIVVISIKYLDTNTFVRWKFIAK